MNADDNERAEQGEKKKVNGQDYSVVGDTVYEKNFWGNWKPVEDSQVRAEAGEQKEIDRQSYSQVGNIVYEKNLWGKWKEVTDDQERAKAGNLNNVDRNDYSSVGDSTYHKNFFGNWEKVEDPQERAKAGDIKQINRIDYSVSGDKVYRKNFFGNWETVEDKQERAEAGNLHHHNRIQYSTVGNQIYRKDFFGNWEEISNKEAPQAVQAATDQRNNQSQPDYSESENYSNHSSPGSSSTSGSGSGIIMIIVVIAAVAIGYALFHHSEPPAPTVAEQQPVYHDTPAPQEEVIPVAPITPPAVADSGHVGFLISCDYCGPFQVYEDTVFLGTVPERRFAAGRVCGSPDVLTVAATTGDHVFTIKTSAGGSWQQTVKVTLGDCVMVDAEQPPVTTNRTDPLENVPIAPDMRIISPEEHGSFGFPRYTDVSWTPTTETDSYEVELQLADKPYDYTATSFSPMPYSNQGIYPTTGTSITIQGIGKQVHRLRVRAIKNGQIIAATSWRYFNYNN